ncbi:LIM and calponiny domains-containing protein [Actinidia chinensis var. chinensis]|uniref:LIM and calponiny domains-containing protein n=1 Tax=Actinidia chinensis var. chinensis TaxID=1590841 RepID=A0A2R6NEC8_ACTCC|nr:LIM and calponiny domains-containing protein [Actinidia chinensis var. chinensis]PSS05724.1 LIM and calponiny domains-containing protein [Actinidia chinensis var. chinensis]
MKKSGLLAAASVAVASATAVSSSPCSSSTLITNSDSIESREAVSGKSIEKSKDSSDKFAPRFDGLRFIETLVTAHR